MFNTLRISSISLRKDLYSLNKLSNVKRMSISNKPHNNNLFKNHSQCNFSKNNESSDHDHDCSNEHHDNINCDFIMDLLKKNRNWVDKVKANDPDYFKRLSSPQKPTTLIVSCSDSRILLNEITETHPGEIFSHRNIGNIVNAIDFNIQSVIQFAVEILKVKQIIVMGHSDCGAIKAALTMNYKGLIDHWLKCIRMVIEKFKTELDGLQGAQLERKLTELVIKEQVLNLCELPIIQKAWNNGQELFIHGCLFEVETGLIRDLKVVSDWNKVKEIYTLSKKL